MLGMMTTIKIFLLAGIFAGFLGMAKAQGVVWPVFLMAAYVIFALIRTYYAKVLINESNSKEEL